MQSFQREYQEKRNFIRMKIDTPVSVFLENEHEQIYTGNCRDLSGGGMLIELDSSLPLGAQVITEITSEHSHAPMLKAKARVCRVTPKLNDKSPQQCKMGLEITEVI